MRSTTTSRPRRRTCTRTLKTPVTVVWTNPPWAHFKALAETELPYQSPSTCIYAIALRLTAVDGMARRQSGAA
jgi:hypothetical protein